MLIHHKPSKLLITGMSGTGKSTYAERYLRSAYRSIYQTVFLYDWQGEFSARWNTPAVTQIDGLTEAARDGMVIFDPALEFEGEAYNGLQFFAAWAFQLSKMVVQDPNIGLAPYPRLFVVDELQLLTDSQGIPPEFQSINETGRRYGIDWCIIAQAINQLHNSIRNQALEVVTFQHADPYILGIMQDLGFDPGEVSQLATGEYISLNRRNSTKTRGALFGDTSKVQQKEAKEAKPESPGAEDCA